MNDQRFADVRIAVVGNGYLITCTDGGIDATEQQFVARDIDEVCSVLHKVLAKPEPQQ